MTCHSRRSMTKLSGDRRAFLKTLGLGTGTALLGNLVGCEQAIVPPETDEPSSDFVRFGSTDLQVSRMCQGTAFRHYLSREPGNEDAVNLLRHCMDIGVNFFNSAEAYGWGGAEITLGKAISGRRDQVIVATKAAHINKDGERKTFTGQNLMAKAEESLKRLVTDYIDLYLLHGPDDQTPSYWDGTPPPDTPTLEHMEEIADAMDAVVRSGKVRYWGVSNHMAKQVSELVELGKRDEKTPMVGLEDYYTIMGGERRDSAIKEMFPIIRRENLGLMVFSPLGGGNLVPGREPEEVSPLLDLIAELDEVAKELAVTRPQICVAWVAAHPEVTSVLAGGEKPEHVEENLKGTTLELPPEMMQKLNSAADAYTASSTVQAWQRSPGRRLRFDPVTGRRPGDRCHA